MLLAKGGGGLAEPADLQRDETPEELKGIRRVGIDGVDNKKNILWSSS